MLRWRDRTDWSSRLSSSFPCSNLFWCVRYDWSCVSSSQDTLCFFRHIPQTKLPILYGDVLMSQWWQEPMLLGGDVGCSHGIDLFHCQTDSHGVLHLKTILDRQHCVNLFPELPNDLVIAKDCTVVMHDGCVQLYKLHEQILELFGQHSTKFLLGILTEGTDKLLEQRCKGSCINSPIS